MNNTQQDIEAMGHSVDIINTLIQIETLSDIEKTSLRANTDHLSIMMGKEEIISYNCDKSSFIAAINAGYAKLA